MTGGKRDRYITKGIKEKVDNILQHIIWKEFVTPAKLKNDEYTTETNFVLNASGHYV